MTTIFGRFPVRILGLAAGAVLIAGALAPAAEQQKKERPKDAPEQRDAQGDPERPRRERQREGQREGPRDGQGAGGQDGGRPVEAIAKELGVTPEQFREAFKKVHPAGPGQRPTDEQRQANRKALSEALNVSPEKLDEVMDKYRPGGRGDNGPRGQQGGQQGDAQGQGDRQGPPDGERRRPEPPFEKIASDLGVSVDAVKQAMQTFTRPEPGQRPTKELRDANAKKLADALNLPVEKVSEVLEKNRPSPPPRREGQDDQR